MGRKQLNFGSRRRPTWQAYQATLRQRRPWHIHWRSAMIFIVLGAAVYGLLRGLVSQEAAQPESAPGTNPAKDLQESLISKKDVGTILKQLDFQKLENGHSGGTIRAENFYLETSLDANLQHYLEQRLDRKNSRFIGIVVMQSDTGRILAMVGFDKSGSDVNPCLRNSFPAASIFKIVTAAAAVDHCGYEANTRLRFNGYKHTLYRSQLKEQVNRYTNTVSFKDSFAQSINPVFGKIGALYLGKAVLEKYAEAFGFNRPIDFELPVSASRFKIKEIPYHWAEIASGFNRETTISPIHAALLASAVANEGRMVAPTMVDRIVDDAGQLLYRNQTHWLGRAMTPKASTVLSRLMEETIQAGTGRKSFRDRRRHKVLSKLNIGGKTGSIFNRSHDARFDWFAGYAKQKKGPAQLAVAVMVAHEEYIGTRATRYARWAIDHYFKEHLATPDIKVAPKTAGG
jgi:cell division protein FtsI/penicillin-binding protein 2